MLKKVLAAIVLLVITGTASPMVLRDNEVSYNRNLGELTILRDADGFHVLKNESMIDIPTYNVSRDIRDLSCFELARFLGRHIYQLEDGQIIEFVRVSSAQFGEIPVNTDVPIQLDERITQNLAHSGSGFYVCLNEIAPGEYELKSHGRLLGGGPIAGAIAYWVAKSVAYGTAVAAAGGVVVATGGAAAGAAAGAIGAIATSGATVGAGVVGGAILGGGAAATATATAATATGVAAAGGVAGAVAVIESTSTGIGLFFAALPFLP